MNCCTDFGTCERGHGCPAGTACHGSPDCRDLDCPGRPARKVRPYPSTPDDADLPVTMTPIWRDHLGWMATAMTRVLAMVGIVCLGAIAAGVLR